jgi:hypothetical protein
LPGSGYGRPQIKTADALLKTQALVAISKFFGVARKTAHTLGRHLSHNVPKEKAVRSAQGALLLPRLLFPALIPNLPGSGYVQLKRGGVIVLPRTRMRKARSWSYGLAQKIALTSGKLHHIIALPVTAALFVVPKDGTDPDWHTF